MLAFISQTLFVVHLSSREQEPLSQEPRLGISGKADLTGEETSLRLLPSPAAGSSEESGASAVPPIRVLGAKGRKGHHHPNLTA